MPKKSIAWTRYLFSYCTFIAFLMCPLHSHGSETGKKVSSEEIAPSFRLTEDKVTLPLVLVDGFPFVEAEILGVKGKLMLDTGARDALALNDHKIPLTGGNAYGKGAVGSGQTFNVTLNAEINEVKLTGYKSYTKITTVKSSNAEFLEAVTPDFLGWIGYNFWAGYSMKLDYQSNTATFYKDSTAVNAQTLYLAGETLIAKIPYEVRKLSNHPVVKLKIGTVDFLGAFDTGSKGLLFIQDTTRKTMLTEGSLRIGEKNGDDEFFDLIGLDILRDRRYDIPHVEVLQAPFPASRQLGLDQLDVIIFGYSFLKNFKTVWDFQRQEIYLLAPAR